MSPLYNVSPTLGGNELALCVNINGATISIDLIIEIAPYCGISTRVAKTAAGDIMAPSMISPAEVCHEVQSKPECAGINAACIFTPLLVKC